MQNLEAMGTQFAQVQVLPSRISMLYILERFLSNFFPYAYSL